MREKIHSSSSARSALRIAGRASRPRALRRSRCAWLEQQRDALRSSRRRGWRSARRRAAASAGSSPRARWPRAGLAHGRARTPCDASFSDAKASRAQRHARPSIERKSCQIADASSRFSRTLRLGIRCSFCGTMPTWRPRQRSSAAPASAPDDSPAHSTSPSLGRSRPADEVEQSRLAAARGAEHQPVLAGRGLEALQRQDARAP